MRAPAMACLVAISCATASSGTGASPTGSLEGTWRAVLASPGGELPFTLKINPRGTQPPAVAKNGDEEIPFSSVERDGARITLRIETYDADITALLAADGGSLEGEWRRQHRRDRIARLPFRATRGDDRRFAPERLAAAEPAGARAVPAVGGTWAVVFTDEGGGETARGEFRQEGTRVTGTFLRATGDDRFLEGEYRDGLLRLSVFDGSHAFLYHARAHPDGTLRGDFWSRDAYHATFTACRDDAAPIPDGWSAVGLRNADGRFAFTFPDIDGRPVSLADARFREKVVIVNLFGSWCPNCNDEAPFLADLHRRLGPRGLEVVGIAFEMTGRPDRDRVFVRNFGERYGISYPLLLGGTENKKEAAQALPDLTAVAAFPTTIFVGRDGRVRAIHSGYAGPGTGEHHRRLTAELEARVEALLRE